MNILSQAPVTQENKYINKDILNFWIVGPAGRCEEGRCRTSGRCLATVLAYGLSLCLLPTLGPCQSVLPSPPVHDGNAMAAVAQLSLTQLSSGNPVYEKYYRQIEAGNTGRVLALDAAAFLKKSGLPDLILGKIWDLADTDGKGVLNKQEFFVALRLVACVQNGLEVSLSSLNLAVPPPRFHDSSSPLLTSGTSVAELSWVVKSEDKPKYDAIFDSLAQWVDFCLVIK